MNYRYKNKTNINLIYVSEDDGYRNDDKYTN